jgi:HSP20 family protein
MIRAMTLWREVIPVPFNRFGRELEAVMERFFRPEEWPTLEGFVPRTNVAETEKGLEVTVELPGMKPEEFHVEVKNGELWITGEKKEKTEEKGKTWYRVERRYGEFQRVLPLPTTVDEAGIHARYEGGVLTVELPKTEVAKPKQVQIEVKA